MNRRMVFYMLSHLLLAASGLMAAPLIVSVIYREDCFWAFLITIGISLALGIALSLAAKPKNRVIYAKEGFVTVALAWIVLSAIGALPFTISREIPSYIDAFFETVSGFTTTGASILTDVESMSRGLLFWRSFTHWIGGMGVIVFIMAIIPSVTDRSIHILRAEMPGPIVGKLVPKARDTAKILYLIYIVMTVIEIIFLLLGGMPLFDSVVHTFGTAGTGGFGIKSDSIASYSPYLQWVITIFMLLFGINFNLYYLIIVGRFKEAFRSEEFWCYIILALASGFSVAVNINRLYPSAGESLRAAFFQVASIITTTGYATADFNLWPTFSKTVLLLLMFTGACAGSTAGGIKISRVVLLIKAIRREIKHMLHPRSVASVRFEGKKVEKTVLDSVRTYLAIYAVCFAVLLLILSFEPYDLETNLSAAAACFNNVGPGFGAVGPAESYEGYGVLSKIALSVAMLLGRLEIYPVLFVFSRSAWAKN